MKTYSVNSVYRVKENESKKGEYHMASLDLKNEAEVRLKWVQRCLVEKDRLSVVVDIVLPTGQHNLIPWTGTDNPAEKAFFLGADQALRERLESGNGDRYVRRLDH
jgi:hypothetical protein